MDKATQEMAALEAIDAVALPDVHPCYCSVILQRHREVVIEGWLLQTKNLNHFWIQPSVAFDPTLTTIAIPMDDVISITPTFPPTPYQAQTTALEADDYADLNPERHSLLSSTEAARYIQDFMKV